MPWLRSANGELVSLTTEVTSLEKQLRDLREMPAKNPPRNGMDSVTRGNVFLKEWSPGCITPACIHHGAMLRVSDEIWRSPECGCGAWWTYVTENP